MFRLMSISMDVRIYECCEYNIMENMESDNGYIISRL